MDDAVDGLAAGAAALHGVRRGAGRRARVFPRAVRRPGVCASWRLASGTLSLESQRLAALIFHAPAGALLDEPWPRERARDLRRFSVQTLERHLERRLTSAAALVKLGG